MKLGFNIGRLGSGIGSQRVPDYYDAAEIWDNTRILDVAGTKYFKGIKGVGNLLITDYDFPTGWTGGFPYKSKATVSAPAGNATLIAADVNNFFYDSGGTPNQIPVTSLFQNIDYANKLYTLHSPQILVNKSVQTSVLGVYEDVQVETYEARVKKIVLYATARTGTKITTCDNYFDVPTKETALWVSPTGSDSTGTGTEINPVATITKALTLSGTQIYVKTGVYNAGATYFTVTKNIKAIGDVKFSNPASNYQFAFGNNLTIEGFNLTRATSAAVYPFYCYTANPTNVKRCYIKNFANIYAGNGGVNGLVMDSCVFIGNNSGTTVLPQSNKKLTIKNSYLSFGTAARLINMTYTGGNAETNITNNRIACNTTALFFESQTSQSIALLNIVGNKYDNKLTPILVNNSIVTNFKYHYNTGEISRTYMSGTGTGNFAITNNNTFSADNGVKFATNNKSGVIHRNITKNTGVGALVNVSTSITGIVVHIQNNRWIADGDSMGMSFGLDETNATFGYLTGSYKYNYMKQLKTNPANRHGLQVLNADCDVRYNYCEGVDLAYIFKGVDTDNTNSICAYNIAKEGYILLKGVNNVKVYNNSVKNTILEPCMYIMPNGGLNTMDNNVVKNNILEFDGSTNVYAVNYINYSGHTNVLNYNVLYRPNALYLGDIQAVKYASLSDWRGAGFEANGVMINPNLDANLIPTAKLEYAENLGTDYDDGLDVSTNWGDENTLPVVVTRQQSATWQNGAYIIN